MPIFLPRRNGVRYSEPTYSMSSRQRRQRQRPTPRSRLSTTFEKSDGLDENPAQKGSKRIIAKPFRRRERKFCNEDDDDNDDDDDDDDDNEDEDEGVEEANRI